METHRVCRRDCILLLCLTMAAATFITCCDARISIAVIKKDIIRSIKATKKLKVKKHIDRDPSSNTGPYGVSSPFSLPPFDSLSPFPQPENAPPFCIYPPSTPQPPTPATPGPIGIVPSPTRPILSPPYCEPSPPSFTPSPPSSVPSPTGLVPSPPVFQPPIVYPPPTGPPSPRTGPSIALWCVAKPTVPDPIIQEAMNYACGSGADCDTIQPSGPCFQPNSVYAHASYALNSYWQRTKVAGGTCSFGGTAILVTVDPSHDGCHYMYY